MMAALALMSASCSGGATGTLWENTDPTERIYIPSTEITQAELERRGVKYETYHGTLLDGYFVEKSKLQKFRDYAFRALGTPVTVTLDTAAGVTVVGVFVLLESGVYYTPR